MLAGGALADAQKAWAYFELVESQDAAIRVAIVAAGGYRPPTTESYSTLWTPMTAREFILYTRGQALHWEICPAVNWRPQRSLGFPGPGPLDVRPQPC